MKIGTLLLLCTSLVAYAQEPSLYFENITVQDGLSHNKVNCMLQDQRGFIWIGTDDGLNRYDGAHFIHYRHKPGDAATVSGNIITDILEDAGGRLWIATADGGISRYDYRLPPQQQFKQYKHVPGHAASIPVNAVNTLLEDAAGFLWLGTSGRSVFRFDKKKERFDDVTKSTKTILDLCADKDGQIWVGRQGGGILKVNPSTFSVSEDQRYTYLYAKLPHLTVTALFKDRDDDIWFGSWDKVLYKYNAATGKEEIFQKSGTYSFQNDELLSFAQDRWGRIWMGGKEGGLHLYDKRSNRFYNYTYDPSREGSVSDNRINCIFIDKEGKTWLGTNRGISVADPHKQQFAQQFLKGRSKSPIAVFDFFEDDQQQVWIGTSEGIFIRSKEGILTHRPLVYKGLPLHATSFFKDEDGAMYVGTNYSLFQYNLAANTVSLLPNTEQDGVMNRIIESRVVSVIKDKIAGRPVLLVLPYGHFMAYYDLANKKWVSRLDSQNIVQRFNLKDNLIRKFYKSKKGDVWMATAKEGLALWQQASLPKTVYLNHHPANRSSIANNNVFDLVEDARGNLWVSTYGGGLHYFNTKTKSFTQIGATNNLLEGVQVDNRQQVWMISNGNVHKYDPQRKAYFSYQLPDLEKTGGVKGKMFKDSRGMLYAGGTNYFVAFHPDSVTDAKPDPKVYLTDFQIFNKSFSHLLTAKEIRLHHKDNYFTFAFSAPHFSANNAVHYAYMLEGFDKDWVDAGERNYVSYSNLDGKTYCFKVRATATPGTWSESYAVANIVVIPPYWKRPLFYIICALVLLLAAYAVYRYRINELLKRQAIRNKIAQDLHDNVGSTLSSISVYSQVALIYKNQHKEEELNNTLQKISATSTEMISELNDTVWAINPRNDNMEIMLQRMESFAKPLTAAQNIRFDLKYDTGLLLVNLEMEKRKNFYLIFKEAVNNIIKYAGCTEVQTSISYRSGYLNMKVSDNGGGFDLSKTSEGYKSSDVYGGGNGLKNMQRRATEMKGRLNVYSEPGKGTTVSLLFPIT